MPEIMILIFLYNVVTKIFILVERINKEMKISPYKITSSIVVLQNPHQTNTVYLLSAGTSYLDSITPTKNCNMSEFETDVIFDIQCMLETSFGDVPN